jgi:hypothetical protein
MKKRLQRIISKGGGGRLVGIQNVPADLCPHRKHGYRLVFFDSPATGSTMCMHVKGLTSDTVRVHVRESNKAFGIETT